MDKKEGLPDAAYRRTPVKLTAWITDGVQQVLHSSSLTLGSRLP